MPSWKERHFVLDSGQLRYFETSSDLPPFGTGLKGGICLHGYTITNRAGDKELLCRDSGGAINNSESFYDTWDEVISSDCFIRLAKDEVCKSVVVSAYDVLLDNRNTGADFLLEAPSVHSKKQWIRHLRAHIIYMEEMTQRDRMFASAPDPELRQYWFFMHSKYSVFLEDNDLILKLGLATRPNKLAIEEKRLLLLTTRQRLIYIDYDTFLVKGIIYLDEANVSKNSTKIEMVDKNGFTVTISSRDAPWRFNFLPKEGGTVKTVKTGTLLKLTARDSLRRGSANIKPSRGLSQHNASASASASASAPDDDAAAAAAAPKSFAEDWCEAIEICMKLRV